VTVATGRVDTATMMGATLTTSVIGARPLLPTGRLRRTIALADDVLEAVGVVLCIPFVILAIGLPIALGVRLLLWIAAKL
jgi:hypothetical protein